MGRKIISYGEFINRFNKCSNDEYEYIDGYTRMSNKIKIRHVKCNHIYEVKAVDFINVGKRCPKCFGSSKKEQSKFEMEVAELTANEYVVVGQYSSRREKVEIMHMACGKVYKTSPASFLKGSRCPYCSEKSTKYEIKDLQKKCDDLYGKDAFNIIGYYKDGKKKVTMTCRKCNEIHEINFKYFKAGSHKCGTCLKKEKLILKFTKIIKKEIKRKQADELTNLKKMLKFRKYENDVYNIHGKNIEILEKRFNTYDKFAVRCNICDYVFLSNFKYLKSGKGCPKCNMSKGERKIELLLMKNNVVYEAQYSIDSKSIRNLRFDFAVIDKENMLHLIEFDGEQHYSIDKQFGEYNKEEKFKKIRRNDNKKNKYCKENNIKLTRIPYFDYDKIEEILKEVGII